MPELYRQPDYQREVSLNTAQQQDWRPDFNRDYGRIVHSASFRRQQGKTQVFPGYESDFFRNRLTHSLEVAQIAEGIAEQINFSNKAGLPGDGISGRLCAAAGLIHDIGHPPFGHNGEGALDEAMHKYGGFEGNAQTLRILCRLEKKAKYSAPVGGDVRAGLDLCHRTLAAILKYDREIPLVREAHQGLVKGYYHSEAGIVDRIKMSVLGDAQVPKEFKTIECSIMDQADDIAYSVYDLEDCLKVGFLTPAGILSSGDDLLYRVAKRVGDRIDGSVDGTRVLEVLTEIFGGLFKDFKSSSSEQQSILEFIKLYQASRNLCEDGYYRTAFSSQLVHEFVAGVKLNYNKEVPALSTISLPPELALKVAVLKQYTYETAIYSARVKLGEFRGNDVVRGIFDALMAERGDLLMPNDVREIFNASQSEDERARTVCDFVAGMTDRYAVEFWARLNSDSPESMFKPI